MLPVERHPRPVHPADISGNNQRALQTRWREDALVAQRGDLLAANFAVFFRQTERFFGFERMRRERARQNGEGLSRRQFLAFDAALRDRTFFDREDRLAGFAVEHEEMANFGSD